jgi:hypothetical protein
VEAIAFLLIGTPLHPTRLNSSLAKCGLRRVAREILIDGIECMQGVAKMQHFLLYSVCKIQ